MRLACGLTLIFEFSVVPALKGLYPLDPFPFKISPRAVNRALLFSTFVLFGMAIVAMIFYWSHDALYNHLFAAFSVLNLVIVLFKLGCTYHYLHTLGLTFADQRMLMIPVTIILIVMGMEVVQVFAEGELYRVSEYVVEYVIVLGLFIIIWLANRIKDVWKGGPKGLGRVATRKLLERKASDVQQKV